MHALLQILAVLAVAILGMILLLLLGLVAVNLVRPDLFRFERVALTARPDVLDALDARLGSLDGCTHSELLQLPESRIERMPLDGRDALVETVRAELDGGDVKVVVRAGVMEPRGLISRPFGVAARGWRVSASGVRTALSGSELELLAMELGAGPLYER